MIEPLARELVVDQLKVMATNWPSHRTTTDEQHRLKAETYRNLLSGITPEAFRWAVRTAMQDDEYFPKIQRLRELAGRYMTREHERRSALAAADALWCRGCQHRAELQTRWRPKRKGYSGPLIHDAAGRLALEQFTRYQCECSASSAWKADAPDDPFMTLRHTP